MSGRAAILDAYRIFRRNQSARTGPDEGRWNRPAERGMIGPTMRKLGYVPALDGVRGVAILLVLGVHLGLHWMQGGIFGVDLFFALSGFLITTLLLEERQRTRAVALRAFYERRARRLLPGLVAVLALLSAIYVASGHLGYLGYSASVLFYVGNIVRVTGHQLPGGLGQMWSLAEEEQFYLVWPALLLWLLHRRQPAAIAKGLLVAALAVMAWRTASWFAFGNGPHVFESPDTRSDALLLGCALAAARFAGFRFERITRIGGFFALAGLLAVAYAAQTDGARVAALPAVALLSVVLVAAATEPSSPVARLLELAPLRTLGLISYSVYLWHGFVLPLFPTTPMRLAAALLVGAASYRFVERPFRRARTRRAASVALPQRPAETSAPPGGGLVAPPEPPSIAAPSAAAS